MRHGKRICDNLLAAILFVTLLWCAALAQAPPKAQPAPTSPPPQAPSSAQPPPAKPQTAQPKPDRRITPEEARELLKSVDTVLKFDSEATLLPIKREVKRKLADRAQVQSYIEDRLKNDEDTQRLKNGQAVLQKFGLLPRNFDLESFLVELLREQVAGYYDPKTQTVNLLDWLPPEQQIPVLAHELTHALQDQSFGLEKWGKAGVSEKNPEDAIRSDEEIGARHAVIEGQAMAVMVDYLLAPTGASVATSPMITQAIEQGMMAGTDSPVFQRAPLYIKRVLLFPYSYGLNFERELLVKGGKARAYEGVLKHPPVSTRQVMEPATYLANEQLAPLPLPDFDKLLGKEYQRFDVGAIGEFDIAAMVEQFAGEAQAKEIFPQWRGGYYYAAQKKSAPAEPVALVFVTRWASAAAAHKFALVYYNTIPNKRYQVTASLQADPPMWSTTEGAVSLAEKGDMVVAIESVDPALHDKIRAAIFQMRK